MHCVSCHNPVEPGGRYCNYCGAPVAAVAVASDGRACSSRAGLVAVLVVASLQVYRGLERDRELREAASLAGAHHHDAGDGDDALDGAGADPPPTPVPPPRPAPTVAPISVIKAGTIQASTSDGAVHERVRGGLPLRRLVPAGRRLLDRVAGQGRRRGSPDPPATGGADAHHRGRHGARAGPRSTAATAAICSASTARSPRSAGSSTAVRWHGAGAQPAAGPCRCCR